MSLILTDAVPKAKMKPFHFFKSGTHTTKSGQAIKFSEADLAAIVKAYNPAVHEAPLVIGHPQGNHPAWGWAETLEAVNGELICHPRQVDPTFSELVEAGRYKKVSAAFYAPDDAANPTPGTYHLRHIGFLGAEPPAVKGLPQIAFAETDSLITIEFGETERTVGWAIRNIADLARRFRDAVLAEKGLDEANKLIPNYLIDGLVDNAARIAVKNEPAFSEPSETESDVTKEELEAEAARLAKLKTELDARDAVLKTQATEFSEAERKTTRAANETALDALIAAGKFAPGLKGQTLDFMEKLDTKSPIEFGEGDGKATLTPAAWFLDLLKKSGTVVNFSEVASGKDAVIGGEVDSQDLANKAIAFQEEQRKSGVDITIEQAVRHVAKKTA